VLMGVSLMLSRKVTMQAIIFRGFVLLGLGYMMNALKFLVPILVFKTMPENFIGAYGWNSPLSFEQLRYLLLTGDVLQLAGFSLLLLAFVRQFVKNKYILLVIAAVIAFSAKELSGFRLGISGVDYVFDLLWGDQYNVYFPVFPWISCILVGMFFGQLYVESDKNEALMYRRMLQYSLVMIPVGIALCVYDFKYHFGDFFHTGAGGIIYLAGFNLPILWLMNKLVHKYDCPRFYAFMRYSSQRVTSLYITQWVLVCWGMGIVGYSTLTGGQVLALAPVMMVLTYSVQWGREKLVEVIKMQWSRKTAVPNT